jgi:glutaredoxin
VKKGSRRHPVMYGLSTCGWCAKARAWLESNAAGSFDLTYVDLLNPADRDRLAAEIQDAVDKVAFPTIFFGDDVVVGYNPDEYQRLLER